MKIAIGCDQGGLVLKTAVKACIESLGHTFVDFGTDTEKSCDYPDFALTVAEKVADGTFDKGILLCGTGIGMAICANKVKGIRAATCADEFSAKATAAHNDSNILTMGGRVVDTALAQKIVTLWLTTPYEGGRHQRRLDKIAAVENKYFK
ncbi:MAG: ribose 5-phosphate isomerase B [Clostridiales bacterium]|jgi:ribose 5-phosphate isomerase B|nr:ribose 5-phosphate isomerase B [Clostridiales bacterium]